MFRNRTSSLKPGVDFIANFRQSFPEVSTAISPGSASGNTSIGGALVETPNLERNPSLGHEDMKDLESTPRAQHEPWRYTPSLLDPSSFAFSPFASQPPGYYSPTPGGTNTPWSNPSVDLQTTGMNLALGLQTPLSLPTSADGLHGGPMLDMATFGHQMLPQFQNYNPFNQHSSDPSQQSASFTPSSFIQPHEAGYDHIEHHGSPMDDDVCLQSMDGNLVQHQSLITYPSTPFNLMGLASMPPSAEKFRFHVTLNAPTAMIKDSDEIPVTYLNKGQAYSFSVVDTAPSIPLSAGTRYRTFVRISFDDEQQRQRPSTCWQLWKEGRGTNEAHQRGGKLQAVEYVEASQPAENDDKRTRVELDTASFDGFSVIWTPGKNGLAECNIAVRFNFLSTDFSHSKGVKGIPVRLCAKTQPLSTNSLEKCTEFSEVSYCKVKLFRDHGAERKLSNDVAHVKKLIDKLNQQIAQSESGMKDFGKRKRTGSSTIVKSHPSQRPGKVHKHKRTWSMSSASSSGGRLPVEEDLYLKLQTMKDMFTSTRPVSILYLRGSDQDDPDLYPVTLPGEPLDLTKVDSRVSSIWQQRSNDRGSNSGVASALVSPSSNNTPLSGQGISASVPANPHWSDYSAMAPGELHSSNPQHLASPPDQPIKIAKTDETGNLNGWIEALGVDPSYKPPLERPNKAVACFYIMRQDPNQAERQEYHRAIYLSERTLHNFTQGIAAKWNIDHQKIVRTLRILERGLQVEMDDDIIAGLNEGQDLVMEVISINLSIESDHTSGTADKAVTEGLELRLIF